MVKLKYFTIILCLFLSCKEQQRYINPYPNGKPLDVQKFMENKCKWKALAIKNYSFKYYFDDIVFKRYGIEKICIGNVTVRNGVGSVTFEGSKIIPDQNNSEDKNFYITSIDEAFDNVLEYYFKYKNMLETGKTKCLDCENEEYDKTFFFSRKILYNAFWPSGTAPRFVRFRIENFKILE